MRTLIKLVVFLCIFGGIGAAIYFPSAKYLRERNKPKYRLEPVVEGDITLNVNATGTVEPVLRVTVGAVVSGPIEELFVDFNDHVTKGQLMARIDPRLFKAMVLRDEAMLQTRKAELQRAEANLQQAVNSEKRAETLLTKGVSLISESELDVLKFTRLAAAADLSVAQTAIQQAQANLETSQANLEYTEIRSPVDGIVIERKIDVGQTLAAQFQTPELFIVAPEMDQRMHIYASVDEADIGLIRDAQSQQRPVSFTVDAYPDQVFEEGRILEVRLSSKEEQNVVTYPVVVETANENTSLLPGMTANLSFQIQRLDKIVKIPNAALRFYPPDRKRVHPDDRAILDGVETAKKDAAGRDAGSQNATERADQRRKGRLRHVWVHDGEFLRARAVEAGISDSRYTQLISGDIHSGDQLVVGEQIK
ncbi:MAG: efflux RND transporter periplasmic adaptor subunit [Planctomycetales bacterium]|nr:efflux RND transporter periplasmic adaptor subunit [Planctomycetales bacterium]